MGTLADIIQDQAGSDEKFQRQGNRGSAKMAEIGIEGFRAGDGQRDARQHGHRLAGMLPKKRDAGNRIQRIKNGWIDERWAEGPARQ